MAYTVFIYKSDNQDSIWYIDKETEQEQRIEHKYNVYCLYYFSNRCEGDENCVFSLHHITILLCVGVPSVSAWFSCPSFTLANLGSNTTFSTQGLLSTALTLGGDGGIGVSAQILNYKILCDASGTMRGTSTYVSVLVEFQCDSSLINVCDRTTVITRQFQFSCGTGNVWFANIFDSSNNIQTLNPTATFETALSDQCMACVDDEQIISSSIDTTTHCFGKYIIL